MFEKEADNYADEHAFRVPYDGSNKFYDVVDFKASKEGYLAGAKSREERIKELEKENAELKTKLLQEREIYWCKGFDSSKDKLTKAKEIIDKLLKSLFLAKGIIRDLIDDTVDFDEYKKNLTSEVKNDWI